MTTTTYAAEFPGGVTATRTTEAAYPYASLKRGVVRFHKTAAAAHRTGGTVRPTTVVHTTAETPEAFVVAEGETCTIHRATGPCGKPGVGGFVGAGGVRYIECAEHLL